ncbi:MAG: PD40 domain-containing protein [Candidatus Latescibacteria bacterium]|nr:PD40 domain-containing protein [Candidatus Latescibacterota bacterium]
MKMTKIIAAVLFSIMMTMPVFAEENPVFGRKLITPDYEYSESLKPDTEEPALGEQLSAEWREYYAVKATEHQTEAVWSPDGSTIAFVAYDSYAIPGYIATVPAKGGAPEVIFNEQRTYEYEGYYLDLNGAIDHLCYSPDGTEICFETNLIDEERGTKIKLETDKEGNLLGESTSGSINVIIAVNVETKEWRIVQYDAIAPQFSRDGRYFSYRNTKNGDFQIRELTTGDEWNLAGLKFTPPWEYCFSADSNYVIFQKVDQFYRVPVSGGESEQISFDEIRTLITERGNPDCSQDDKYIVFDGTVGERQETFYDENGEIIDSFITSSLKKICVLSVETGISYPLLPLEDNVKSTTARFSPDGTCLCYALYDVGVVNGEFGSYIYIMVFDPSSLNQYIQTAVDADTPSDFVLYGNYPNPFNPSTTIEFSLPETGFTDLIIYNMTGQKVRELISGTMSGGVHSVVWDGRNESGLAVSAGMYLTRLRMGENVQTGSMTLVK